ncbi:MAG: M15 family metallopeptidase [Pisciglobus halotolerans]|nr:M15 family metallopeptidase [Pisciglobus halotolerans]
MKLNSLFFLATAVLLTGCSTSTNQSQTTQTGSSKEHSEQSVSSVITEEEKQHQAMIDDLPEASTTDWNLILVNNWTPIDKKVEQAIPLVEVEEGKKMDERIVSDYKEWMDGAANEGYSVYLASSYRSVDRQQSNYTRKIQQYMNEGFSKKEATRKTEEYIAIPGRSEHHTGLALDMVDIDWINAGNGLDPEYDTQESQQWLVATMSDYGFILRYPKDKEEETGINYESWHFRYVGKENAEFMKKYNLSLEEYVSLLQETEKDEK